jgi:hypothetical protein
VSRKNQELKREPDITEAAEKAGLLIRGLQNRLAEHANDAESEPADPLEWELQNCFAIEAGKESVRPASQQQLRKRVVDRAAERILSGWDLASLEEDVIERVIALVFERLSATRPELRNIKRSA